MHSRCVALFTTYQAAQWKQYMGPAIIVLFFRNSIFHIFWHLYVEFFLSAHVWIALSQKQQWWRWKRPLPPSLPFVHCHTRNAVAFPLPHRWIRFSFFKKDENGHLASGKERCSDRESFKKAPSCSFGFPMKKAGKSWQKREWGNFPVSAVEFILRRCGKIEATLQSVREWVQHMWIWTKQVFSSAHVC